MARRAEWTAEQWRNRKGDLRRRRATHDEACLEVRRASRGSPKRRRWAKEQEVDAILGPTCAVYRCRGRGSVCGGRLVGACMGSTGDGTDTLCADCANKKFTRSEEP